MLFAVAFLVVNLVCCEDLGVENVKVARALEAQIPRSQVVGPGEAWHKEGSLGFMPKVQFLSNSLLTLGISVTNQQDGG